MGTALVLKASWDYRYENTFDEKGRIIKRKKTMPGDPNWAMELLYEYDDKGLLAKFTSSRAGCGSDNCSSVVTFTYEYWDNHFIAKQ